MDVEVWLYCLVFIVVFLSLFLIYLYRRVISLESESKLYCNYLSEFICRHNLLCKEVSDNASSIFYLTDSNYKQQLSVNQIFQRLGDIDQQVDFIMSSWQNEWGSGESWKDGFRPDGSKLDDEE